MFMGRNDAWKPVREWKAIIIPLIDLLHRGPGRGSRDSRDSAVKISSSLAFAHPQSP